MVSLWAGIKLTRTITGAVHELYEGTQHVREGDFSYRIPVKGNDQLAELGGSFNTMTENLGRLIVVAKEKERLESELAIARDVQNQLFPKDVPFTKSLELKGVCSPARMVSGDYYDFMALPNDGLAFAIGDVAGKGISAALLMATIQSTMRTQLSAANGSPLVRLSAAKMVATLNRQLYATTSPEKYATFYFALYDEALHTLTYTNAGHLAPMLLRGSDLQMLDSTGTVVGAFPVARLRREDGDAGARRRAAGLHRRHRGAGERVRRNVRRRSPEGSAGEVRQGRFRRTDRAHHGGGGAVDRRGRIAGRYDHGGGAALMKILTAAEMREVDRRTIEAGIPGIVLMENAGHRVVEFLAERFAPLAEQRIVVLCGKGNNGGDGLVIARQLHTRFAPASLHVVLLAEPGRTEGRCGGESTECCWPPAARWSARFRAEARAATLVVDALLGTGVSGAATGRMLEGIREINHGFPLAKVVAVDMPSGMPSDSGEPVGRIRARRLHRDVHRAEGGAGDAAELRPHRAN